MKMGIKTIEALAAVKRGYKAPKGRKPGYFNDDDVRISDKLLSKLASEGLVTHSLTLLTNSGVLVLEAFNLGKRYR